MTASIGAPVQETRRGAGVTGVQEGAERGAQAWARLAKEHSLPSVDKQRLRSVTRKAARGGEGGEGGARA